MPLRISMVLPSSTGGISAVLEGLTGFNYAWMTAQGGAPLLYESGVVYRRERAGNDDWLTAPQLLEKGYGDCEDVATYRAAELRCEGEPARAIAIRTRRGKFHAVVQRADGAIEDPSLILLTLERRRHHAPHHAP